MNHWCYAYGTEVTGGNQGGRESGVVRIKPGGALLRWTAGDSCPYVGSGGLHLQEVAFAGYQLVEYGVDEESDEEPGNQAGDDHYCERPLGIGADSC
jgi:hypothetical protein